MKQVYLDAAASYPPVARSEAFIANPHSLHMWGVDAMSVIKKTEALVCERLGKGKVYWTGSGSEANRLAIETFCEPGRLVTTEIEHRSITQLTRKYGVAAPVDSTCYVDLARVSALVNKFTQLVSIQAVNNETGAIQPRFKGSLTHSDVSQGFCKLDLLDKYDLASLSAHKIGGPKGLGCLWLRQGLEGDIRYLGTPDPGAIEAFGRAIEGFPKDYQGHVRLLEEVFLHHLDTTIEWNVGHDRVPGLLNIAFTHPYIDATELMMTLTSRGIHLSLGAACNNKLGERSHVLSAMGLSDERIDSSVRISLNHYLSEDDVVHAAKVISATVKETTSGSQPS
jgi:cysteine desulfurase